MNLSTVDSKFEYEIQNITYDPSFLKSRIVHFGFGAFHRSHQALFTSELLNLEQGDWGICEINLFDKELIEKLRQQNHGYTVLEKSSDFYTLKHSGSITESLHPELDGCQAILSKLVEDQVAIVSLTITEKGYCADFAQGRLDATHPMIKDDLCHPQKPSSIIGYIVEGLRLRKLKKMNAFSILSCDNINNNGHVAKAVILDYAKLVDESLAEWIEDKVTFPCTMVDRITPAVEAKDRKDIHEILGYDDPCGVVCEPFRQWVIEDNFVSGRPNWNKVGAQFVADVAPFEEMKLRMLNGSHSFMAYMGNLAGFDYISEVMENNDYRVAVSELMFNEQGASLEMPEGVDLDLYAHSLIERFSNPSLQHRTWQIAMDGSQKIPPRFCESLRILKAQNKSTKWIILGIAAWMKYVGRRNDLKQYIDVVDPLVDQFDGIYKESETNQQVVSSLLNIQSIFGADISNDVLIRSEILDMYELLDKEGSKKAIQFVMSKK
ncbi:MULTISPECIES: mannitol dehydrogenase family protein [unclassified Aliivibrio]|uniref:mannitol dehydrogenase family protein n=1 Tax=unclassified Aliivibrio TaxID=2645654 RepID=UPI00080EE172|nr:MULTISPECIES: fructuronate reductase [unclassified Aliivibrio]OCH17479.1 fructuronate reductase [Aliivibrio sp. 1S165]OCH23464.1 fructuronate reductase [Aliivibrio sp. 1S128]OCH34472.1 fructuronate reductase [Aliivibrio sp. 1S175]